MDLIQVIAQISLFSDGVWNFLWQDWLLGFLFGLGGYYLIVSRVWLKAWWNELDTQQAVRNWKINDPMFDRWY